MRQRSTASPTVRALASGLVLVGAAVVLGSVFADQLGLIGGGEGFGWKQLLGLIVGLVVFLVGLAWLLLPPVGTDLDEPVE